MTDVLTIMALGLLAACAGVLLSVFNIAARVDRMLERNEDALVRLRVEERGAKRQRISQWPLDHELPCALPPEARREWEDGDTEPRRLR